MPSKSRLRKIWLDERGSAIVEATILTPVLLLLFLGVYEFSWFFDQQKLIEVGLRDAARYVARSAASNDSSCDPGVWSSARNLATTGSVTGGQLRVPRWTASDVNFQCLAVPNNENYLGGDGTYIYVVKASTNFHYLSLGFFGFFGLSAPNIVISHEERVIGPG